MNGKWKRFLKAQQGNTLAMTAIAAGAMIGAAGMAIDYARLVDTRTKFTAAADATALSAVTMASELDKLDKASIIKKSLKAAQKTWESNLSPDELKLIGEPKIDLTKNGTVWSAKVEFNRPMPTSFMSVLGVGSMTLQNVSVASTGVGDEYWEFSIVIDTSSSMGIGATQADMDALKAHPSIGCMFACHWANYSAGEKDSVTYAQEAGIKLRVDVVDDAVDGMISEMKALESNIWTKAELLGLASDIEEIVPMTSTIDDVGNKKLQLATTSVSVGNTNFAKALKTLTSKVGKAYDGKNVSSPKKAVFIVTDGIHDSSILESNVAYIPYADHQLGPSDGSFCNSMKAKGVLVGVLYIDYITPAGFEPWIDPYKDKVLPELKECASEDMFFNATTPASIKTAMTEMLEKALDNTTRLTQ